MFPTELCIIIYITYNQHLSTQCNEQTKHRCKTKNESPNTMSQNHESRKQVKSGSTKTSLKTTSWNIQVFRKSEHRQLCELHTFISSISGKNGQLNDTTQMTA